MTDEELDREVKAILRVVNEDMPLVVPSDLLRELVKEYPDLVRSAVKRKGLVPNQILPWLS